MNLFDPPRPWPDDWQQLQPHWANLIEADPPWQFQHYSEAGWDKSAEGQYETMPTEDIAALPVAELADVNCLLLLWTRNPMLKDGLAVLEAWGFESVSWVHWRKVSRNGKALMGTGHRVRNMGELVLVGTKGNPQHRPFRGGFDGVRRKHSQKPEEWYRQIDRYCPTLTRRVCLFSRQSRAGWMTTGDQRTLFDNGGNNEQTPRTRRATTAGGQGQPEVLLDLFGGNQDRRSPVAAEA